MQASIEQSVTRFIEWAQAQKTLQADSTLLYEDMASQSGEGLPVIYQPFDPQKRWHWYDVGLVQDFLYTTAGAGGRVLDFGPGDGWPSLMLAPFVGTVVGVDASPLRVKTCHQNATRMGIENAAFTHYSAGSALPFETGTFDAVVAASSLEQCPDIPAVLKELHRVLKPGGRLRMRYESLTGYANGQEVELWLNGGMQNRCGLMVYLRDIPNETVEHYYLRLNVPHAKVLELLEHTPGSTLELSDLLLHLDALQAHLSELIRYRLHHPGAATWMALLAEAGFEGIQATHDAGRLAVNIAKAMDPASRNAVTLEEAQSRIAEIAPYVCDLPAPLQSDPMILAVKA